MPGTVQENLSNRKLLGILSALLIIQTTAFYIGAFKTPSPSSFEQFTATKCIKSDRSQLAIPRHAINERDYQPKNCRITGEGQSQIIFAVQLPFPRDQIILDYSRWMQNLLVIINPEFTYNSLLTPQPSTDASHSGSSQNSVSHSPIILDVTLGVKNKNDKEWITYAERKGLRRTITCRGEHLEPGYKLDCDLIQLFELQSLFYDFYLINLEIRDDLLVNVTNQFGMLSDITGVAIHQNGGFTQIWLSLKTIFFIMTLATLVWYCKRLMLLPHSRSTKLIERILIGLGLSLTQLNAPIEFLSLNYDISFMSFFNDLRQGIFYCVLLSFWIIFVGEHLQDEFSPNNPVTCMAYMKELMVICIGSTALLIFDLCERGIQAFDPFLTIWEMDSQYAIAFIVTAGLASFGYLGFLAYYIYMAYTNISSKPSTRLLQYRGVVYRFKFLLFLTLFCAVSTFFFYLISQFRSEMWQMDDDTNQASASPIEWTSAMFVSVYAIWNLYVITLLIFYAPSLKGISNGECLMEENDLETLTSNKETDMLQLQQIARKQGLD